MSDILLLETPDVVMSSYSFVWWNWARWETELDWMALNGINIALMYTGQEAVLLRTFKKVANLDLTKEIGDDAFFNGPAFLSWSRGQGMTNHGGYDTFRNNTNNTGSLPLWWIDQQESLGKIIAARMRLLGVTTILRGFEGNLPVKMHTLYPHAKMSKGNMPQLDSTDPLFAKLADAYMEDLISTFGTGENATALWDIFHNLVLLPRRSLLPSRRVLRRGGCAVVL
jgi:alpha-N-acetylglucosaminidase